MRKILIIMALLAAAWVQAAGQSIYRLDITAEIYKDGSALVTQEWDVDVVSGTEWYVPIENLGKMTVSDLTVTENGRRFITEDYWDIDRDLDEKRGRCGINETRDGVELCWGQGSYDQHQWTVQFRLTGLVQALQDADAFNFRFINPGMVALPQQASVTLKNATGGPEWTLENTRMWGFGFDGTVYLENGAVVARAPEGLRDRGNMTLMVAFEKGMFQPTVSRDMAFEEMEERAKKGSDYEDDPWWLELIFALISIAGVLLPVGAVVYTAIAGALGYKYRKSYLGASKITDWYRQAPLEGNLSAAYCVLQHGVRVRSQRNSQTIVGALFLRWILDGYIRVLPEESGKRVNLDFSKDAQVGEGQDLYNMAREAAGSNLVLEKDEFEKWSRKNYKRMSEWPGKIDVAGSVWLEEKGLLQGSKATSPKAADEMANVIRFKNFLKDFTLTPERTVMEVGLWKDYLVYAQLYGMAKKVSDQLQKLFPAELEQVAQSVGMDTRMLLNTMYYNDLLTRTSMSRAQERAAAKAASAGRGGSSSFGGGGGFSGGGFGGGSR